MKNDIYPIQILFWLKSYYPYPKTILKFVIYIEMTHKKFSLTSQFNTSTILHIMFKKAIWPGRLSSNNQSMQYHVE